LGPEVIEVFWQVAPAYSPVKYRYRFHERKEALFIFLARRRQ